MALPPRGMRNSNNLPFQSGFVALVFTVMYGAVFKARSFKTKHRNVFTVVL